MKTFFRIASYLSLVTAYLVLTLILLFFTVCQTDWFKNQLKEAITRFSNENINGVLNIGSIEGNFISRVTLNKVSLISAKGDTLVSAKSIQLRYMPLFALFGNINISSLTLSDPDIRMEADSAGNLNLADLIKPSPPDTVEKPGFDLSEWRIRVKAFSIENGTFTFSDQSRTIEEQPAGIWNYQDFKINNLNFFLSASLNSEQSSSLIIRKFSFDEQNSGFSLKNIDLNLAIDKQTAKLNYLTVITDSSKIGLSAVLNFPRKIKADSTLADNFLQANMVAEVKLDRFTFSDLTCFIPVVDMLRGTVSGQVRASGTLDSLHAEQVELEIGGGTNLAVAGWLYHLTDSDRLNMDVRVKPSEVYSEDVLALLPLYPIPDFSQAGKVEFTARYKGKPLTFLSEVSFATEQAGSGNASVFFDFADGREGYKAEVSTRKLNLQPFLWNRQEFKSDLTVKLTANGSGYSLESLNSAAHIETQKSTWQQITLDSLVADISAKNRTIDLAANVISQFGTVNLKSSLVKSGNSIDIQSKIKAKSVNAGKFAEELPQTNFWFDSEVGVKFGDTLGLAGWIQFDSLKIGKIDFGKPEQKFDLKNIPGKALSVNLNGSWLDANVKAKGDLNFWIDNIDQVIRSLKTNNPDSIQARGLTVLTDVEYSEKREINWDVKIKSVESLLYLFNLPELNLRAEGKGKTLVQGFQALSDVDLKVDSLRLNEALKIENLVLSVRMDSLDLRSMIKSAKGTFTVNADQITTAKRNWGKASVSASLNSGVIDYKAALEDEGDILSVNIDGRVLFTLDSLSAVFHEISLKTPAGEWALERDARLGLTTTALWVRDFSLKSESSVVTLNGGLSPAGTSVLNLTGKADDISAFLSPFIRDFTSLPKGELILAVNVFGTLLEPNFTASLDLLSISLARTNYGDLRLTSSFDGDFLSFDGEMVSAGKLPFLKIKGFIPFALREATPGANQDSDIRLDANNFDLGLLQGFIPDVREISGKLNAAITVSGKIGLPKLEGNVTVAGGAIRLGINNVRYSNLNGSATLKDDMVRISSVDVESKNGGKAKLYGSFRVKNYIPNNDFNLSLVLNGISVLDKAPTSTSAFSGDVELTGVLNLKGNFARSFLNGNLRIKKAALNIITASANLKASNEDAFITFVGAGDTTKATQTDSTTAIPVFIRKRKESDFIAGLNAFVQIDASQNAVLTLVLNKATGERLTTELTGNLNLQFQQQNLTTNGVLTVQSGKYNFYTTQFDVEQGGTLSFTGDLGEPEMNLVAKTTISRQVTTDSTTSLTEINIISLGIKGSVLAPQLTYDIATSRSNGKSESTTENPDMKDKAAANIISLILLGQWLYDPYLEAGTNPQLNLGNDLTSSTINAGFGVLSNHIGRFLGGVDNQIRYVNFQVHNSNGKTENIGGVFVYDIAENWSLTGGLNYNLSDQRTNLTGQDNSSRLGLSWRLEHKLTDNLSWDIFQSYDPYTFDTRDQIVRGVSLFYRKSFYRWGDLIKREEEPIYETQKSDSQPKTVSPKIPGK
ncbi:MAG: translocation/assembly module TamB domain-containing protein [Bacteroidetes bacterium]|nr:translocation/assembly module TamB domain-containing protein [Bacteroidota bacterium]